MLTYFSTTFPSFASIAHSHVAFSSAIIEMISRCLRNKCIPREHPNIDRGLPYQCWVAAMYPYPHAPFVVIRAPRRSLLESAKAKELPSAETIHMHPSAWVCDPSRTMLQSSLPLLLCEELHFASSSPLNASMLSLHHQYLCCLRVTNSLLAR